MCAKCASVKSLHTRRAIHVREGSAVVILERLINHRCRALPFAQAVEYFKAGSQPVLVATDVCARGLDIPDVEVVINYSFPLTVEVCFRPDLAHTSSCCALRVVVCRASATRIPTASNAYEDRIFILHIFFSGLRSPYWPNWTRRQDRPRPHALYTSRQDSRWALVRRAER